MVQMVTRRLMMIRYAVADGVRGWRGSQAKTNGNPELVEVTRELLFVEKGSSVEGCGHARLPPGRLRVPGPLNDDGAGCELLMGCIESERMLPSHEPASATIGSIPL